MLLAMYHNGHKGWNFANLNTNLGFAVFFFLATSCDVSSIGKKCGYSCKPFWLVETETNYRSQGV